MMRFDIWFQIDLFITIYTFIRGTRHKAPDFVTSCHTCFVVLPRLFSWLRVTPVSWLATPVSWFYHACFRDFVSRLVSLPSWTVCPRLFSWLRVTPGDLPSWTVCPRLLFCLCQFLYRKPVFIIMRFHMDFIILERGYILYDANFALWGFNTFQIQVWW